MTPTLAKKPVIAKACAVVLHRRGRPERCLDRTDPPVVIRTTVPARGRGSERRLAKAGPNPRIPDHSDLPGLGPLSFQKIPTNCRVGNLEDLAASH